MLLDGLEKIDDITTLAYIGDAVYELYVRIEVSKLGLYGADKINKRGVVYANAMNQAKGIKKIFEELSEEEQKFLKSARNKKVKTKSKNADIGSYKWATAFEALVGRLYIKNDVDRMEEIIYKVMGAIDE
ncbi:MAG: ribonuclease III domain-containing protein [Eubacteriales bacterium]|nr:ribonuclease III domain-containing protein [Eubacteriales bacterium]MDY3332822.1 ribonuclease III domain-containing protein [Gallibacter sp.]